MARIKALILLMGHFAAIDPKTRDEHTPRGVKKRFGIIAAQPALSSPDLDHVGRRRDRSGATRQDQAQQPGKPHGTDFSTGTNRPLLSPGNRRLF
jgi:hypothetical protein